MRHVAVGVALCALIGTVYWPVHGFDYVNFDDGVYLLENPRVEQGLTLGNVRWAFTTGYHSNWHPLTWISWFIDVELFGMDPGGFHVMNVILHALACLALYAALWRMTGQLAPSAMVAVFLAIHPIHAESVAWISERKDVLSMLFLALTLLAYAEYARRPNLTAFVSVIILFDLGLMAKPMLVTLPVLLLVLDYWPLERFARVPARKLILEKVPLLVLSVISAVITYSVQQTGGAVRTSEHVSWPLRLENAVMSYDAYLGKLVFPVWLAPFYPLREDGFPWWRLLGAGSLLCIITALCLVYARRRPYWLAGWLWYGIALTPVIGIIPVGGQAMADRYAYVPFIGLYMALVWTVRDWATVEEKRRRITAVATAVVCAVLIALASVQVRHWRNSESLWRHALAVTNRNHVAHNNLGVAIRETRPAEALEHFERAVDLKPDYADGRFNLGNAYHERAQYAEAIDQYLIAADLQPRNSLLFVQLGLTLGAAGRLEEAEDSIVRALRLNPQFTEAWTYLGDVRVLREDLAGAIDAYTNALGLNPAQPALRRATAELHLMIDLPLDALDLLQPILGLTDPDPEALFLAGRAFADMGTPTHARHYFDRVLDQVPDHPGALAEVRKLEEME